MPATPGDKRAAEISGVLRQAADRSVGEVRRILDGLRPRDLAGADLATALGRWIEETVASGSVPVRLVVGQLRPLAPRVEDAVFRVVTEAVTNARRHAAAGSIEVHVDAVGDRLVARVVDDGQGINPSASPGIGLTSMRARAADLRGELDLHTSDADTTVTLTVPVRAAAWPRRGVPR